MTYFQGHTWGYTCNYVSYMSLASTKWQGWMYRHFGNYISCYWHVPLNKYGCHVTNIIHTVLFHFWHIDPTLVHICANAQQPYHPCHILLVYMCQKQIQLPNWHIYARNMATKLHEYAIYAKYLMGIYEGCMSIHVPHVKSLVSTKRPGMLYTDDDIDDTSNIEDTFWLHSFRPNQPKNISKIMRYEFNNY